jgi:hypothetical protein
VHLLLANLMRSIHTFYAPAPADSLDVAMLELVLISLPKHSVEPPPVTLLGDWPPPVLALDGALRCTYWPNLSSSTTVAASAACSRLRHDKAQLKSRPQYNTAAVY